MGDLRDELRRLFDPVEPIALDEVEATGRRRRRRHRWMLAAGGATAVTAGIAAVVLVGGTATTNVTVGSGSTRPPVYPTSTTSTAGGVGAGVVPWADEPATAPPPRPGPPAPAYPECHAGQLTAAGNSAVAATSHYLRSLEVTNTSGSDCSLSGYPTSLTGIHPDGTRQLLTPGHDGFFEQNFAWPANLHPGQSATVGIATSSGCPAGQQQGQSQPAVTAYAGEILGLPGGGSMRASAPFNAVCGVSLTTFGVPEPPSRSTSTPTD